MSSNITKKQKWIVISLIVITVLASILSAVMYFHIPSVYGQEAVEKPLPEPVVTVITNISTEPTGTENQDNPFVVGNSISGTNNITGSIAVNSTPPYRMWLGRSKDDSTLVKEIIKSNHPDDDCSSTNNPNSCFWSEPVTLWVSGTGTYYEINAQWDNGWIEGVQIDSGLYHSMKLLTLDHPRCAGADCIIFFATHHLFPSAESWYRVELGLRDDLPVLQGTEEIPIITLQFKIHERISSPANNPDGCYFFYKTYTHHGATLDPFWINKNMSQGTCEDMNNPYPPFSEEEFIPLVTRP